MYRRTLLSALLLALSGCSGSDGEGGVGEPDIWFSLRMTPVTDVEIARRAVPEAGSGVYRAAIENGTVTRTTTHPRLSPTATIRVHDNSSVYRLSSERTDDHGISAYVYTVELNPAGDDVPDTAVVAYEGLPPVDQSKLATNGFERVSSDSDLGYGLTLEYAPEDRNRSALVPTPARSVVEWQSGVRARVRVVGSRTERTKSYQYTATKVGTLQEVGRQIRRDNAFELSGLSADQREIVRRAIDDPDGYSVEKDDDESKYTPSPAVEGLYDIFAAHVEQELDSGETLTWNESFLVNYDSTTYWASLDVNPDAFGPDQ